MDTKVIQCAKCGHLYDVVQSELVLAASVLDVIYIDPCPTCTRSGIKEAKKRG